MNYIQYLAFCLILCISTNALANYEDGLNAFVTQNFDAAITLWEKAADQGDVDSQYQLGVLYLVGKFTTKNLEKARKYLEAAATASYSDAEYALATIYISDTPQKLTKAIQLLKSAELHGDKNASSLLFMTNALATTPELLPQVTLINHIADKQNKLIPIKFSIDFINNPTQLSIGKDITKRTCILCHKSGLMGAPIIGNRQQWKSIDVELNVISEKIARGESRCPPRGGDYMLNDDQVRSAVYYLLEENR